MWVSVENVLVQPDNWTPILLYPDQSCKLSPQFWLCRCGTVEVWRARTLWRSLPWECLESRHNIWQGSSRPWTQYFLTPRQKIEFGARTEIQSNEPGQKNCCCMQTSAVNFLVKTPISPNADQGRRIGSPWGSVIFDRRKTIALSTNTQSRFAPVVLDSTLGSPRLAGCPCLLFSWKQCTKQVEGPWRA